MTAAPASGSRLPWVLGAVLLGALAAGGLALTLAPDTTAPLPPPAPPSTARTPPPRPTAPRPPTAPEPPTAPPRAPARPPAELPLPPRIGPRPAVDPDDVHDADDGGVQQALFTRHPRLLGCYDDYAATFGDVPGRWTVEVTVSPNDGAADVQIRTLNGGGFTELDDCLAEAMDDAVFLEPELTRHVRVPIPLPGR